MPSLTFSGTQVWGLFSKSYPQILLTRTISVTISPLRTLTVLFILLSAWFLLHGVSGSLHTPIKKSLTKFPSTLGEWQVRSSRKTSDAVIKMLGVSDYVELNYSSPSGQSINFYAAFYELVGNGSGYHSPKNCIPGGGWGIARSKTVEIFNPKWEGPVVVNEMIVRKGDKYQMVLYWYQNRGRIIHSEYLEKIYLVIDAILKKRRDGTFIRLMTPVPDGDIPQTEKLLQQFAALAITELKNFLPGR